MTYVSARTNFLAPQVVAHTDKDPPFPSNTWLTLNCPLHLSLDAISL